MVLMEEAATQDINQVWKRFETILDVANGLINYAPVFRDYYYEALDSFRRDNVQYIEVRVLLPPVSDIEPCADLEGGQGIRLPPSRKSPKYRGFLAILIWIP